MDENIALLKKLADAAQQRIREILERYGEKAAEIVKVGAYGAPSSRVDVEAENEVVRFVKENDLPFNIFSEELGYLDRGYEDTLIMDPLDGSYNAENGISFYAVSLALSRGDLRSVRYGLVRDVPHNRDYWAIKGQGAYLNGERLRTKGNKSLFIVYLGKKADPRAFEIAKKARRVRNLGSASLEMCMVAEGIADLFLYEFYGGGALRIVDIAASTLIVNEAGGLVLDENLKPLNMHLDFGERKNVIAVARRELLEVFK